MRVYLWGSEKLDQTFCQNSYGKNIVVLKRTVFHDSQVKNLLGAGVFGDGLGALRHGVLGELTREEEPDSGLDLLGADGGPLVVDLS